ncbi:MAG: hypothetical protein HY886_04925 [Deltaproteobacteria bacterium]|nr:hypothetical protein [Deltaproteobacteria bacterium]
MPCKATLGPVVVASTTYAMAALNTGWCARFKANDTLDVKSVKLRWSSVSAAGTVQLRIETIDATTGKPSGTLYDANAVISFTPVAGVQTYTFATLPTTGLTIGNEYAIVLLTTVAGTTQTLQSSATGTNYASLPVILLTAANGTTRTNFAEVTDTIPIAGIVWEDNSENPSGLCPFHTQNDTAIYTTNAGAVKMVLPAQVKIAGVFAWQRKSGTPAGDLRVRVFDSSNNVVANTTVTVDKDSLLTQFTSSRRVQFLFPAVVTLAAGTYRIVWDSASSANSSNCWTIRTATFFSSAGVPSASRLSTCPDVGTPVWTDSTTDMAAGGFLLDDIVAGTGGGMLVHPGMTGGARG